MPDLMQTPREEDALDILFPVPATQQEQTFFLWAHRFEQVSPRRLDRWAEYGNRSNGVHSRPGAFARCLEIQREYLHIASERPVFGQMLWSMAVRYAWLRRFGDGLDPVWERDAMAWARDHVPCPLPGLLKGVAGTESKKGSQP